ncbi:MAG: metallopeptidase [Nanoarchaeota archaeon]|nr:metallopeptidase [Nanoarchaeota archaeon]MBU1135782.1 metallopeptidase [Nanoarchaeota archaeon]MBU2519654.1 metallopeptidase [Nanoarchaeota archaeon]
MISYQRDTNIDEQLIDISKKTGMEHVDISRVIALRSYGTKSRRIIARCHVLSRAFQEALGIDTHYLIEVISEQYDKLSEEEKIKTLIHELMHIPKSFGGGFRHHSDHVTRRNVERMYRKYLE